MDKKMDRVYKHADYKNVSAVCLYCGTCSDGNVYLLKGTPTVNVSGVVTNPNYVTPDEAWEAFQNGCTIENLNSTDYVVYRPIGMHDDETDLIMFVYDLDTTSVKSIKVKAVE